MNTTRFRAVSLASTVLVAVALFLSCPGQAQALDDAHQERAKEIIAKGIAYLRTTQGTDGSWSPQPGPAVTAMAVQALLDNPQAPPDAPDDAAAARGLAYLLANVHDDGSIHHGILENYNTAICLSTLSRVKERTDLAPVMKKAQDYLRHLQWDGQPDPTGKPITKDHPFYGGAGYGGEGRPDMSNTQMMLQGLHDSGLKCTDPAYQRALVFITRCQGTVANAEFADRIAPDGGFIYATSRDKEHVGELETKVGSAEVHGRDVDDGSGVYQDEKGVSRLRTYGSATYAGFKSYLYAELDRRDPRVVDAWQWIQRHYTLDQNPGLTDNAATPVDERWQGLYYYYVTFARALAAWGEPTITTPDGKAHDWRADLIDKLASLQKSDGSWVNDSDRWLEGDSNLVTCYALIALEAALK